MEIGDGEKYNATELDKNVVIGLYTYDNGSSHPSKNEIDLEFSEWGDSGFKEGWFIVWEDASPGQLLRDRYNFTTQLVGKSSVHSFDWMENSIDFKSVSGIYNAFKNFGGDGYIPQPQNEKVLMNIWLVDGEPYSDNMKSAEIIISHFEFSSNDQDVPLPATPATVAPIITGVVGADDGYISADEVAYGLVVYGSGPAYAEIKIYINDIYVDTGDVLADGFWAVVVAKADLGADGAKTLYATATEDGLAESAHSNEVTFILDTTEGDSEEDDMFPAPTLYPIEIEGYAEIYYPTYVGLMYFTLSWTSVSGADGYRIDWAIDSPDPSNFEIYTNDDYLDFPDLVSETNAIFIEGSSYVVYWRVRARNRVSGKIGYWSNIQSVYCPSFDEVVWTPVP